MMNNNWFNRNRNHNDFFHRDNSDTRDFDRSQFNRNDFFNRDGMTYENFDARQFKNHNRDLSHLENKDDAIWFDPDYRAKKLKEMGIDPSNNHPFKEYR